MRFARRNRIGLPKLDQARGKQGDKLRQGHRRFDTNRVGCVGAADQEAAALQELAKAKQKTATRRDPSAGAGRGRIAEATAGGAKIIDLMEVLRKSLSKNAVVTRAGGDSEPISLAERRAAKKKKAPAKRKTAQKRARRA